MSHDTVAQGQDTATQTENAANSGFSLTGGLLGLFDFRWTLRLTQRINHHYRTQLFERIQSLPITSFDDERIGDAVYRVMYDTPVITDRFVIGLVNIPASSAWIATLISAHFSRSRFNPAI